MMFNETEEDILKNLLLMEMSFGEEDFKELGGKFHTLKQCKESRKLGGPKYCVIHKPSNHHMVNWPKVIRSSSLIERVCKHGVGHPDPDSAAFLNWKTNQNTWGVHGCDGCCIEGSNI